MPSPLDVDGQLSLEVGSATIRIEAQGDTLVIELPSLEAGREILKHLPKGGDTRTGLRRTHEGLVAVGLSLRIQIASKTIARLGVGARAGFASRLAGLDPLELDVGGLMALGWRPGR